MVGTLKVHEDNEGPIISLPRPFKPSYSVASYLAWALGQLAGCVARTRRYEKSRYLQGNFAPIRTELDAVECTVESGALPDDLCGDYTRIGPNPLLDPVADYHWFDGDGMVHSVRLKGGKALFTNRFVGTARLKKEKAAGQVMFMKMGDIKGVQGAAVIFLNLARRWLLGPAKKSGGDEGDGTANTALVFHARRLMALNEGDLPYAIRLLCNGMVQDLGRMTLPGYGGQSFTAHPKVDAKTGELIFFGYSFEDKPYFRAGMMDPEGKVTRSWDVDVAYPTMTHDIAATANYVVLPHLPLILDPAFMTKDPNNLPIRFDKTLPARFGLLRRDSPSSAAGSCALVQWFEITPSLYSFHVANAFEDASGRVHLFLCVMEDFDFRTIDKEGPSNTPPRLCEVILDPATGAASGPRRISDALGEFPVIHPTLSCHPNRYAYLAKQSLDVNTHMDGILKMDLTKGSDFGDQAAGIGKGGDGCVGTIQYEPGCYGGEAVFVPRKQAGDIGGGNGSSSSSSGSSLRDGNGGQVHETEDDGYLVVFVYHEKEGWSKMHIYDAKTMSSTPLAVVAIPQRVPYGFHGLWVTEEQIAQQRQQ